MPRVQVNGLIQSWPVSEQSDEITYEKPIPTIRREEPVPVPICCASTDESVSSVHLEQIALIILLIAMGLVYFSKP